MSFFISRMENALDLPLPVRATPLSSGLDLRANVEGEIVIFPSKMAKVPTGVKTALPAGYEVQIRPRSGLAFNSNITTVNAPGTIDADYRGEISVLLINLGEEPFTIRRGDRIAQMVVSPVILADFTEVEELPETSRGSGGFGHSGIV